MEGGENEFELSLVWEMRIERNGCEFMKIGLMDLVGDYFDEGFLG